MATFRDILGPVFGAEALARAEGRTYEPITDPASPYSPRVACKDGRCAAGVLALDWGTWHSDLDLDRRFPTPRIMGLPREDSDVARALWVVINANDEGLLARPGSLTAMLDAEYVRL